MQRMKIVAFKDNGFDDKVLEYTVLINPAEFNTDVSVTYGKKDWVLVKRGDADVAASAIGVEPSKMEFELIFDATGAVVIDGTPLKVPIDKQIEDFKKVLLDGELPRFVELQYGKIIFKCRLENMSIRYSLFRPDGTALRATVAVRFYEELQDAARKAASFFNRKGWMVNDAHDKIDTAAEKLHGDKHAFIQVAKDNKVKFFRSLVPAMLLKK